MTTKYPPICIVSPSEFETAQTSGSIRLAAIAPQLFVQSAMWGGLFKVEPGARTGIHHHGKQQTVAYVLSGTCDVRWGAKGEYAARAYAGDFIHVPAFLRTWKSIHRRRILLGSRKEYAYTDRREPSGLAKQLNGSPMTIVGAIIGTLLCGASGYTWVLRAVVIRSFTRTPDDQARHRTLYRHASNHRVAPSAVPVAPRLCVSQRTRLLYLRALPPRSAEGFERGGSDNS
jgi:uncharacterized RmlC-like cupin family protein